MKERCLSLPTLTNLAQTRDWTGVPSTTQLINGTMYSFLEIRHDYYQAPDERAYAMFGSNYHSKKGGFADKIKDALNEERIGEDVSGIFDYYEDGLLIDYKTTGYYKISKYLKGETLYPKEYKIQLNKYRIEIEKMGFPVKKLKNEILIRDHNFMAKKAGVKHKLYYLDVPFVRDSLINKYYKIKRSRLVDSLKEGKCTHLCTPIERWQDRKCKDYCPVNFHCPYWQETYNKEQQMKLKGT